MTVEVEIQVRTMVSGDVTVEEKYDQVLGENEKPIIDRLLARATQKIIKLYDLDQIGRT